MNDKKSTDLLPLGLPTPTQPQRQPALPAKVLGLIAKYTTTPTLQTLVQAVTTRTSNNASVAGATTKHSSYNRILYYGYLQPELNKRAAKQLMGYVLNPTAENIAKAEAMYTANPRLLFIETEGFEPASGVDENGRVVYRKFIGSVFQAVLGTGDSALYNHMATCFDKVENGIVLAREQIKEKFPNGFDYPPCSDGFNVLIDNVVKAIALDTRLIADDNPSEETKKEIADFRKAFLPTDVTQGHHFNLNHLIKAFQTYNQRFDDWNWNQRSLFWCQIIGYLQRLVPVVDAQAFCQGLYYLLEKKEPQSRSLSLYNHQPSSHISYFPRSSTPDGLGFDFGIYTYFGGVARAGGHSFWGVLRANAGQSALKTYLEQRHQNLTTFDNTLNTELAKLTQQPGSSSAKCTIL